MRQRQRTRLPHNAAAVGQAKRHPHVAVRLSSQSRDERPFKRSLEALTVKAGSEDLGMELSKSAIPVRTKPRMPWQPHSA